MTFATGRLSATGLLTLVVLVLGLVLWTTQATLSGAVVAPGRIEPREHERVVQHPDGGILRDLRVRDGDRVAAGDVLGVFDGTELRSARAVILAQRIELEAMAARLVAERDGLPAPVFPARLVAEARASLAAARALDGQSALHAARAAVLAELLQAQDDQVRQIGNESAGLRSQLAALDAQSGLVGEELAAAEQLLSKGLTQSAKVLGLKREMARLTGQRGETEAEIARNEARMAEIRTEMVRLRTKRQEDALAELRDVEARLIEVRGKERAFDLRLTRLAIPAPASGIVHDMQVAAAEEVIRPGATILTIVPQEAGISVSARIDPMHIDSLRVGQEAMLRLSALDRRTTPELRARVVAVSADTVSDQRTGLRYYTAELDAAPGEQARIGEGAVLPGMPVEVFILTGDRTPASYLLKPFSDYLARAFRD